MSFGLTPRQYLDILKEAHHEFKADDLSLRRLITSCVFANHLPEIIFAEYGAIDPAKVHGQGTAAAYRKYAIGLCSQILIVQDLCDFGKHGPHLNRTSVQISRTAQEQTYMLDTASMAAGVPNHFPAEKLMITLKDGTQRYADQVLAVVVEFWRRKFVSDSL